MAEQPAEETRGGEKPGDWKVDGSAAARAAAVRAQIAVMHNYIKEKYGKPDGTKTDGDKG